MECICGNHEINESQSNMELNQQKQLVCTIPSRNVGEFDIECLDSTIQNIQELICLQSALDSVAYWLKNNDAFRKMLALLVIDYEVASKSVGVVANWLNKGPAINSTFNTFITTKDLPIIRIKADLKTKFNEIGGDEVYGLFDPNDPDYIYFDSGLIKNSLKDPSSSLQISFLIFSKVVHEFSHWITHFTMKKEQQIATPTVFFGNESGEFIEKELFGGVVSHHSKSAFCPWEIELVLKDKEVGRQSADFFHVDFMKLFFEKDTVGGCTTLSDLTASAHTTPIQNVMLAKITNVSTNDELFKAEKIQENYTTTISLEGAGGKDFFKGGSRGCHVVRK